jgi:acyl-CoA thioesterase
MNQGGLDAETIVELGRRLEQIPFARLLGLHLQEIGAGTATLGMKIREDLKRNNGIAHGGAIASLIDSATAFAILSLDPAQQSVTIDLTVNFLRPVTIGVAVAKARVIRAGKRVVVVSAEAFDEGGTLVATALSTYIKN